MQESRRERKKLLTKRRIADAAIALFLQQGYDQTTVAQIAAEADVDPKTFFNYFGSKDEVVFDDQRYDDFLAAIRDRRSDEGPGQALARLVDEYDARVVPTRSSHGPAEQAALSRLILTTPALQARLQSVLHELQRKIADALVAEFPDLDEVTAAAMTGSLLGAMYQAALVSIERGQSRQQVWQSIQRARDVALHGLLSVPQAAQRKERS
ncbi:TetR/AcrR family transcriptional regulator [Saccharopolyspora sp. K220]|uniref:TetR/AcrR family transcriptional regulator n=1 Tax=Saccharopolyspora soli TaxID=2926618 RepID=UPI001F5A0EB9|nr:TetR/AcrR family transcriptional regulator [Saccharopolyspora soli]MCI2415821.1 TetR/AcrR family transcriptional regulator [Saccharopolyspora soli]